MIGVIVVLVVLAAAPAAATAAPRPSCDMVKRAFYLRFGGALEATDGKARFSGCWATSNRGRAVLVRITGAAPQRLRIRLRPRGDTDTFSMSARAATRADEAAARRARPEPPALRAAV
jgi:hypothetical protein